MLLAAQNRANGNSTAGLADAMSTAVEEGGLTTGGWSCSQSSL
jgi:hypothetical protein